MSELVNPPSSQVCGACPSLVYLGYPICSMAASIYLTDADGSPYYLIFSLSIHGVSPRSTSVRWLVTHPILQMGKRRPREVGELD